ncbi:MAG: hypothetical protein EBR82_32030 [Caulobacteraceae bacterium]|nr:hypothetical protein [Caulobacteraceae bacterium]
MSWNFRLLDRSHLADGPWVEIVEAFYHPDGSLKGFTEPYINAETREDVVMNLMRIIDDIRDRPVLKMSDFGLTADDDPKQPEGATYFVAGEKHEGE